MMLARAQNRVITSQNNAKSVGMDQIRCKNCNKNEQLNEG